MKKTYHSIACTVMAPPLLILSLLFNLNLNAQGRCASLPVGCPGADLSNSFLNSSDPATIEYDNIVSTFHSTLARQSDASVLVWGEAMAANGTDPVITPQELNATNYPGLTGTVLRVTGGANQTSTITILSQFMVLTTDGLFAWGGPGNLIPNALTTSNNFQKITVNGKADGLPPGVTPSTVRSLFGTYRLVGLVTCNGEAWTLVNAQNTQTASAYGDGIAYSATNNLVWHRVKINATTNLENVVAMRGSGNYCFVALRSDGTLWTWGSRTYAGDGSAIGIRMYATQMTLPSGVTPKMIGMIGGASGGTNVSYHLLSTTGSVYGLGFNTYGQLGDYTTTNSPTWVQTQKSATAGDYLTGIAWISPGEHDWGNHPAVNALSTTGELWSWGRNDKSMLGQPTSLTYINPTFNSGGVASTDRFSAVATGGHTTIVVKRCTSNYGYVGHKIAGSMGDGTSADGNVNTYSFGTAELDLCAAPAAAKITSTDTVVCQGTPYTVTGNNNGGTFSAITGNATIGAATGVMNITGGGDIRVVYSAITNSSCPATTDTMLWRQRDMGNLDPNVYPTASATTSAANSAWLGSDFPTSDCSTRLNDEADGLSILSGATPVSGSGTQTSPWQLAGSQTYNFNLTVNGNGTPKPVYWAVWYDVNGDGDFTDAEDFFQAGNITHGSPVTTSFAVTVPSGTATGGVNGAIRVVATAENTAFTKAMNGTVALNNGEVEDFFVSYAVPLPVTLTNFTASAQGNTSLLRWSTSSETNNKGFEIQRSTNATDWLAIGFVNASGSNNGGNYQYTDHTPANGINYYRLKQMDIDERYTYSDVRKVTFGNAARNITIYPNPVRNTVWIDGLEGRVVISIYNNIGALIQSYPVKGENLKLDLKAFDDGIYQLRITDISGILIKTAKIVKLR